MCSTARLATPLPVLVAARSRVNPPPRLSVMESGEPNNPITISFAFRDDPPVTVGVELELTQLLLPEAGCPEAWSKGLNVLVGSAAPAHEVASPIAAAGVELRLTVIDSELIIPFALPTHSVSVEEHVDPVKTFLAEASKVTPVADRDETAIEAGFVTTRTIITSGLVLVVKDAIANVLPEVQPPVTFVSGVGLEPIKTD